MRRNMITLGFRKLRVTSDTIKGSSRHSRKSDQGDFLFSFTPLSDFVNCFLCDIFSTLIYSLGNERLRDPDTLSQSDQVEAVK